MRSSDACYAGHGWEQLFGAVHLGPATHTTFAYQRDRARAKTAVLRHPPLLDLRRNVSVLDINSPRGIVTAELRPHGTDSRKMFAVNDYSYWKVAISVEASGVR